MPGLHCPPLGHGRPLLGNGLQTPAQWTEKVTDPARPSDYPAAVDQSVDGIGRGNAPMAACFHLVPGRSTTSVLPPEVIGGEPGAVRRQGALSPEELLTVIEPIRGIDGAIIGHELQLVELWRWGLQSGFLGCCPRSRWCSGEGRPGRGGSSVRGAPCWC